MVHPLSKAEADRVFTDADRLQAALDLVPQLKNLQQRERRAEKKAVSALADWFSKTGSPQDLIDFERYAETQQIIAQERGGIQAKMREYLRDE